MSDPKDYLRKMINHTIEDDMDGAKQAFKDYLVPKTMQVMGITSNVDTSDKAEVEPAAEVKAEVEPAAEVKAEVEPAAED